MLNYPKKTKVSAIIDISDLNKIENIVREKNSFSENKKRS